MVAVVRTAVAAASQGARPAARSRPWRLGPIWAYAGLCGPRLRRALPARRSADGSGLWLRCVGVTAMVAGCHGGPPPPSPWWLAVEPVAMRISSSTVRLAVLSPSCCGVSNRRLSSFLNFSRAVTGGMNYGRVKAQLGGSRCWPRRRLRVSLPPWRCGLGSGSCLPLLGCRGNPRFGSPDQAAAAPWRRDLLEDVVKATRGEALVIGDVWEDVAVGVGRCSGHEPQARNVHHGGRFFVDVFLKSGWILPTSHRSPSRRMRSGTLIRAALESGSCRGGVSL